MKGSKEHKRYISLYRSELKRCHFDDLHLFKLERDSKNIRYKPRMLQLKQELRLQDTE